jgi:hypothetical protein
MRPHERGALLVAAVFDAFLTIYKARVADLLRIATGGTGVLPVGQIHPDLVDRLADEAARAARRVLEMCVRALDYCPPVDITFGDYLRALVTADFESDPVDDSNRRVAFVEAFRRHGIVPEGIRAMSVDGLRWQSATDAPDVDENVVLDVVRDWRKHTGAWSLTCDRYELFRLTEQLRARLHRSIVPRLRSGEVKLRGIDPKLPVEVHSFRPATVTDVTGELRFLWVVELTQLLIEGDTRYRGGCTLLLDGQTGKVRYSIRKPLSATRKERQQAFLMGDGDPSLAGTYFAGGVTTEAREPFALLHRI